MENLIIPLKRLHTVIPRRLVGGGIDYDPQIIICAIASVLCHPPGDTQWEAWRLLLTLTRFFDCEVSRSIHYHFLQSFPLCQSVRAAWVRDELKRLIQLCKALDCERDNQNIQAIQREATTCCRVLSEQFTDWCEESYSVDMWFSRMIYASLLRQEGIFASMDKNHISSIEGYIAEDIESIISKAIYETVYDPRAVKIWYFVIIQQISSIENADGKLRGLLDRCFQTPLFHSIDPIHDRLIFTFDEFHFSSPKTVAEIFPELVDEFQRKISTATQSASQILSLHQQIGESACLPDSKLSLESIPKTSQAWYDLLDAEKKIHAVDATDQRYIGLIHCVLHENPFSEALCLLSYYHLKICADSSRCTDFLRKVQKYSPLRGPVIAVVLSSECFSTGNVADATQVLDAEKTRFIRSFQDTAMPQDAKDTVSMLTMQKMFLIYKAAERDATKHGAGGSTALRPVREAVMKAVKDGVFSWHIFVYLCSLEVQWGEHFPNPDSTKKMVGAVMSQASHHAESSADFLHRLVDFVPITQNHAEIIVAFEKMIQGFHGHEAPPKKAGSILSVWGRFYHFLKETLPSWELESYEARKDRMGYGHGGLIAEKSWQGDSVIEKHQDENVPLTVLQKLVLSSGPAGYASLVKRYTVNPPRSTELPMDMLSSNEHAFLRAKQAAWMSCLDTDAEVKASLRQIGLRTKFENEDDYKQVAGTIKIPQRHDTGRPVQRLHSFVLEPAKN
ncbi:aldo/keto reductase [Perkinsela sp. CCAP 1560/4]|nr:aldo/keto reductase [Perkinsela sp. CCAP 1560/4]|eukprot:KNH01749.1 aldo/keto reductase [Perkinsela sp. CCAP 1560/4]